MPKKRFESRHLDQSTRDDDWSVVQAHVAWSARRHMIVSGTTHTFEVRDEAGKTTRWIVRGEACPIDDASPAPDPEADA
jgi:hypothetical protein